MQKVLGLDLGSSSIGWAFIEEGDNNAVIKKLGVRLIPFTNGEDQEFKQGKDVTLNKGRTLKRGQRRGGHRYKQRRAHLQRILKEKGMLPSSGLLLGMSNVALFGLRGDAVRKRIGLDELGRVLLHMNQKRGYRSSRMSNNEETEGKKLSDYLTDIKNNEQLLIDNKQTIGQYFHSRFLEDPYFRVKKNIFPRECYLHEFNSIWNEQQQHYPDILTEELRRVVRDEIIFYQRRLKSQKGLVSECRFEKQHKVAHRSSPLFQVSKIWESINNITFTNKKKEVRVLSLEEKTKVFERLTTTDKLSATELLKLVDIKKGDGWMVDQLVKEKGVQGDLTRSALIKRFKALGIDRPDLLALPLELEGRVNKATGELIENAQVSGSFERSSYFQLWHVLYSVDDTQQTIDTLVSRFGFTPDQAAEIAKIDFKRQGYGNKSTRAIRRILPFLMQGMMYSEACTCAGYDHSNSLTTEQNMRRELAAVLQPVAKNSLRQPVVEKILNQLVHLMNAIMQDPELGRPDEIRVELARDLKQSKDERNDTFRNNNETDRRHKQITERLEREYPAVKVTRKVLEKYKLWEQQNGICLYSGKPMQLSQVLTGDSIDVDHVIPQSKLFDDSFQNKVLVFQRENAAKDNATAYDHMRSKSETEFNEYLERVNALFEEKKIGKGKRNKLLMAEKDIPDDMITRQMNETRFISKEATKILKDICRNVYSTTGSVTEYLRRTWGYNEILKQLNLPKYEAAGQVKEGRIEGWSKRDDHRHHAIDALVVACTKQAFIQRLNTLNAQETRQAMQQAVNGHFKQGLQRNMSLLEGYIQSRQPFTTQAVSEAVAAILISQKAGKKVATVGTNEIKTAKGTHLQKTLTPRGQLHKEQVYGKIKRYAEKKTPLNGKFSPALAESIANPQHKALVLQRLAEHQNDPKKAFKDLDKAPIWLDAAKSKALTEVTLWEEHFVYKYTLDTSFKEADIQFILDEAIKQKVRQRFDEYKGSKDHPLKNLQQDPIWLNEAKRIPILSVRCKTNLNDLVPLHKASNGLTSGKNKAPKEAVPVDYVSTRNNHHIAIYKDAEGALQETVVSLWQAIERKQKGLPVIITDPAKAWDHVLQQGIEDQDLLESLPKPEWTFLSSLQQNEMFVFRMTKEELEAAIAKNDMKRISPNLYRVRKLTSGSYWFNHHLETEPKESVLDKKLGKCIQASKSSFNATKVIITRMGEIKIIQP